MQTVRGSDKAFREMKLSNILRYNINPLFPELNNVYAKFKV